MQREGRRNVAGRPPSAEGPAQAQLRGGAVGRDIGSEGCWDKLKSAMRTEASGGSPAKDGAGSGLTSQVPFRSGDIA